MISSFGTGDAFSKLALEKWTALGNEDHYDDDGDDGDNYGIKDCASPNSHKHFFPYMGSCASIWDNVRHHCHPHHNHHHHTEK